MQLIVAFNEQHIFKYVLSPGTQVIHKSSDSLNRKRACTKRKARTLKLQTCCRDSREPGLPERHFPAEGVSVGSLKLSHGCVHIGTLACIQKHPHICHHTLTRAGSYRHFWFCIEHPCDQILAGCFTRTGLADLSQCWHLPFTCRSAPCPVGYSKA